MKPLCPQLYLLLDKKKTQKTLCFDVITHWEIYYGVKLGCFLVNLQGIVFEVPINVILREGNFSTRNGAFPQLPSKKSLKRSLHKSRGCGQRFGHFTEYVNANFSPLLFVDIFPFSNYGASLPIFLSGFLPSFRLFILASYFFPHCSIILISVLVFNAAPFVFLGMWPSRTLGWDVPISLSNRQKCLGLDNAGNSEISLHGPFYHSSRVAWSITIKHFNHQILDCVTT